MSLTLGKYQLNKKTPIKGVFLRSIFFKFQFGCLTRPLCSKGFYKNHSKVEKMA